MCVWLFVVQVDLWLWSNDRLVSVGMYVVDGMLIVCVCVYGEQDGEVGCVAQLVWKESFCRIEQVDRTEAVDCERV